MLENIIRDGPADPNPWKYEDMVGVLLRRGEQIEAFERLGLDDTEWRKTGVRARTSTIVTTSYHQDRDAALVSLDAAIAIIGTEREVIKFGTLYGTFTIENVAQRGDMLAVQNAIGTYLDDPTIRLQIQWAMRVMP